MKKLRKLINVLSEEDIEGIRASFYRDSDKVAILFNKLISNEPSGEIREYLGLSTNAFTTLGSRLKNKIENHLVEIAESPKDDLLRKLQNIDDLLFSQEPRKAVATLKKLEYELKRYDLSNELTVVYKHLKWFYLNKPEYFTYSKLYNRHVAYSLALDKAEDILGNYFKEYGFYYVMKDKSRLVKLNVMFEEMLNVCALYQSHRMQVYQAAMEIKHRLYVDPGAYRNYESSPLDDVFANVEKIFDTYPKDSIYIHLKQVFKAFKFEYYYSHGIMDKADVLLEELKPTISQLLVHYENFGFPAQLLNELMLIGLRDNNLFDLPDDIDTENMGDPSVVMIDVYNSVIEMYHKRYDDASRQLFALSNRVGFKDYPELFAEVKCLITLVKYQQQDKTLFVQNYSSAQRLLRRLDKNTVPGLVAMMKFLGVLAGKSNDNRQRRLTNQVKIIEENNDPSYSPLHFVVPILREIAEKIN